ncbi:unnamed protein product, partial [Polarella glacialis]
HTSGHSPTPYVAARNAVATYATSAGGYASPAAPVMPMHMMQGSAWLDYQLQSPRRLMPNAGHRVINGVAGGTMSDAQPKFVIAAPSVSFSATSPLDLAAVESGMRTPAPPAPGRALVKAPPERLAPGTDLAVGHLQLRCAEMLGSGSYSTVWRADVKHLGRREDVDEVALKDVFCRSESALQQSLFEVQLLIAVERGCAKAAAAAEVKGLDIQMPRLPLCLAYQVDPCDSGWNVRMALTRLKGEQLDGWLQRAAEAAVAATPQEPWTSHIQGGVVLARKLLGQLGPTLDRLAPLAWHRDVNSHNVLVCSETSKDGQLQPTDGE